ncbi:type II toxin-antitoxin system HicB family antitoxin [Kribbella sp. CA-294648]|uniref:type II toxin-antitoxin system HicB family antitoxin n=1 Tax=Kribbella sp. CA-294648 TaxID=3239948 RepID=UPI003D8DA855
MKTIRIQYHHELDGWWADSPDISGYVVVGDSLAEVRGLVKDGLPFYLETEDIELLETSSSGAVVVAEISAGKSLTAPLGIGASSGDVVRQHFSAFMSYGFAFPVQSSNGLEAEVNEHLELAGWQ